MPLFVKAPGQTDRGDPRRLGADDRRAAVDRRPARRRGQLGVRRPLAVRRQLSRRSSRACPRTSPLSSTSPNGAATSSPMATTGSDWPPSGTTAISSGATSPSSTSDTDSDYTATIDQRAQFADLPTDEGEMPFAISGTVDGPDEPPELLVAVNGRLAGVIGGYAPDGAGWTFIGYLADLYRTGQQRRGGLRGPPFRRRRHAAPGRRRLTRASAGGSGRSCACHSAAVGARR